MNSSLSSSSPPLLYIEDDDEDVLHGPSSSYQANHSLSRTASASETNLPRKKRRLSHVNIPVHPSVAAWPKRQRNNHLQPRSSQALLDPNFDSEPILLDPNEYIIEKPDASAYRSFDWTIQMQQPPPLIPTRIPANPLSTILNGNSPLKRSIDRSNPNSNNKFIPSARKTTAAPPSPRQTSTVLPLPLPTAAAATTSRPHAQRGRPAKTARIPTVRPTSPSRPEQPVFATKRPTSRPPALSSTVAPSSSSLAELHRSSLNGTGIFSAFHDSKYYRCNICKFKSATSSTLLQHLFTHMFFCDRCSFYTYSYYNLSQHLFDKHQINLIEEISEPLNPKAFDLLYVTRCQDGKFALCMDRSSSSKQSTSDQNLIISSAVPNASPEPQSGKRTLEESAERNHIFVLHDQRSIGRLKRQEKSPHTFVLMKHGKYFSLKKPVCLHSLTLEYQMCRTQTLRQLGQPPHRVRQQTFSRTRLIDEVTNCLKTIVNQIVQDEEDNSQSTFICALPSQVLQTVFAEENFDAVFKSLKLKNKYSQDIEEKQRSRHEKNEYTFVLSSPDFSQNDQSILSSLHSSLTNGDSIYTQSKIEKLPASSDNTHRYLRANSNSQVPMNNSKKITSRPITSKPMRSTVDKNNNSVTSTIPSVIILD